MEKLKKEEYEQLIKLITERTDSIRQESYSDKDKDAEYHDLGFILIKLNTQLKMLTDKER